MNAALVLDWSLVSGSIGFLLPMLIEKTASHVKGKHKILVVLGSCFICSCAQWGIQGGFKTTTIPNALGSFFMIVIIAINSWNQMWKRWFPSDKDPFEEPFKLYKKWAEDHTDFTFCQ
jgi:hypothetical protein